MRMEFVQTIARKRLLPGVLAAAVVLLALCGSDCYGSLAARYVNDVGIENDPNVIFAENFEEGSLEKIIARWSRCKDPQIMSLSDDTAEASSGKKSLLISQVREKGNGAHLYKQLLPGYEQLYLRFYAKIDPNCKPIGPSVKLGGYNPPTAYPQPDALTAPAGDEKFVSSVTLYGEQWRCDFYTIWMEMRPCPTGNHWGNDFINDPRFTALRGQWVCVEMMLKMNKPVSEHNGEMALWTKGRLRKKDGQVISHLGPGFPKGKWVWDSFHPDPVGEAFEGFRWRSSDDLKINFLWLSIYIPNSPYGQVNKIWFDDLVVATEYIGPINRKETK